MKFPDIKLIHGTEVRVSRQILSGYDRLNAPIYEWESETVQNVLPQPGSTSDLGAERPEGVRVDMTFHFPKGYGKSLRACLISYAGRDYRVIGDPQPYLEVNTPREWNLPVETEAVDG